MKQTGWRMVVLGLLMVITGMLAGCGSGGSTGVGSVTLVLDKATVAAGGTVVATVTLSASSGQPVNNVKVTVMSSDNTVIVDASGYTNQSGVANIYLPVLTTAANKTVTLMAKAENIAQSTSVPLAVTASALSFNLATSATHDFVGAPLGSIATIFPESATISFKDGNGNPVANQTISLYIDSITNKAATDQIIYNPVQGSMIIAPPGVFTGTTDSAGNLIVPMRLEITMPAPVTGSKRIITVNWRIITVYQGSTFTLTGSSMETVTNAPAT